MIDGLYIRSYASDLAVKGDGRTIEGLLAPYNEIAAVNDGFGLYYERFIAGCFDRCLRGSASYLKLQLEHNGHWVGRGEVWRDRPSGPGAGLYADLRLDDTEAGREAAFKVRDGQTPGLSLAFQPSSNNFNRESSDDYQGNRVRVLNRERVKALHHVALCQQPAYASAQVMAVRSAPEGPPSRLAYWQEWTRRVTRD